MKCITAEGGYFEGRHIPIHPEEDHGLFFGPPEDSSDSADADSDDE